MKIYTEQEILNAGYYISNDIIENIDINIIAHFGNCVCFEMFCQNRVTISGYNNTKQIGQMLKFFVEFLGINKEDGLRISEIKNIPIRIITSENKWGKCVGFGHYTKDKFILTNDFVKIGIDDNETN